MAVARVAVCMAFLLMCIPFSLLGQTVMSKNYGRYHSSYVTEDTTVWSVGIASEFNANQWSIVDEDQVLEWSELAWMMGWRLIYKWIDLSYLFKIKSFDPIASSKPFLSRVRLNLYPKHFFISSSLQYTSLFRHPIAWNTSKLKKYIQNSRVIHGSIWNNYLFQAGGICLASAYNLKHRQTKSAGSWIISSYTDFDHIYFNREELQAYEKFQNTNLNYLFSLRQSLGVGYTQSLVYENLHFNVICTFGAELRYTQIDHEQARQSKVQLHVRPNVKAKSAIVYHLARNYFALFADYYPAKKIDEQVDFVRQEFYLRIVIGRKF